MFSRLRSLKVPFMIPSKDTVFLHLANGYLIYAIISLLVLPTETLFIDSKAIIPFLFGLFFVLLMGFCSHILNLRYEKYQPQPAFVGLITAYLFLAIIKSPSLLIDTGFFLLGFAVYAKLSWEKIGTVKSSPWACC